MGLLFGATLPSGYFVSNAVRVGFVFFFFFIYLVLFYLACYFALMASDFSCYSPRKVTKRRPPLQLRPCKRRRGSHNRRTLIMLWKNSQKTLRQFSQNAHDDGSPVMALLKVGGRSKSKTQSTNSLHCHLDVGEILMVSGKRSLLRRDDKTWREFVFYCF